jgi:hypothetical protein
MKIAFISRRRDSAYYRKKAGVFLDALLNNKKLHEAYLCAEQELDPEKVAEQYTQRLLDLQVVLDKKEEGLGYAVATSIASKLDTIDRFTAIGLINFILDIYINKDSDYIKSLPAAIEEIKGKNGNDSNFMKYHFVSKVLPKHAPTSKEDLTKLVTKYVQKYNAKNQTPNEQVMELNHILQVHYKGDDEQLKKDMRTSIQEELLETLGWAIKNAETFIDVQALENSEKDRTSNE